MARQRDAGGSVADEAAAWRRRSTERDSSAGVSMAARQRGMASTPLMVPKSPAHARLPVRHGRLPRPHPIL